MKISRLVQKCSDASESREAFGVRRIPALYWLFNSVILLGAALSWQARGADVPLPFYDPLPTSYGDGVSLGSAASATIWSIGNSVGSNGLTNRSSAALSYPGLASASGLGVVIPPAGSSSRDIGVSLNPGTFGSGNPTLYVSFLLN